MTTAARAMGGTRTGLVLAWSFTLLAILAIGLVVATVPLPPLSAAATGGMAPTDPLPQPDTTGLGA